MVIHINIYKNDYGNKKTHLPNADNDPWIIIGDLNEQSNPNKKYRQAKVAQLNNNFNKFIQIKTLI